MSKKKQNRPATGAKSTTKLSDVQLLEDFTKHRSAGRLREAMDCCKLLLQRKTTAVSIDTLAELYLDRAGQLASKGMHREAVALWDTRRQQCNRNDGQELLLTWLLQSQQFQRAAGIYAGLGEAAPSGTVASFFATTSLAGNKVLLKEFSAAHPLTKNLATARDALHAYSRGDDEKLAAALAAISFRSPYRELRPLLHGLQLFQQDQATGEAALARMSPSSAFGQLAALIAARSKPLEERLNLLASVPSPVREVAYNLWGIPPEIRQSLQDLSRLSGASISPRDLLQFVLNNAESLGHDAAQRLAIRILPHYPEGLAAVRKRLGEVDKLVDLHVRALSLGLTKKTPIKVEEQAWKQLVEAIKKLKQITPRQQLMAAMILRHLAKLVLPAPFDGGKRSISYSIQSLDFDPGDKATYLTIIQHFQEEDNRKKTDRWLECAIKNLPGDPEIRMAAARAAFIRGAYKKAAGYAEEELSQNPINNEARNMLITALLAHAAKQVTSGKQHLAGKELAAALSHTRENVQRGNVLLNMGFLDMIDNKATDNPLERLAEGYQVRGGGMGADLRLLVDGRCMGIPEGRLLKEWQRIKAAHGQPWDHKEVMHAVILIRQKLITDATALRWAMGHIEKALTKMSLLPFTTVERQDLCEALAATNSYNALQAFAQAGLRDLPESPDFLYYESFGRYRGSAFKFQERAKEVERRRLEKALYKAENEGDIKCASKLEAWLGMDDFDDFAPPHPFWDGDDDDDGPDFPLPSPGEMLDFINKMMDGKKKKDEATGKGPVARRKDPRSLLPFGDYDDNK